MLVKIFFVRDSLLLQNFLQKLGYIERKMVISDKSEMLNKYIDLSTPGLLDGKQSLHNFTLSCKTEFLRLIPSKI